MEANFLEVGRQTGRIVNKVLKNPQVMVGLQLVFPNRGEIGVSFPVARILDLEIPAALKKKADHIVD